MGALAVMLSACGGSQPSGVAARTGLYDALTSSDLSPASAAKSVAVMPLGAGWHRAVKRWVAPDIARAPRLLFISDSGTESMYIFTLPALRLEATIPGFEEPQGLCSNTSGDVWVANSGTDQMLLLSRTGTLLKTIDDLIGYPVGCAVDPTNGNLAVFNLYGISTIPGEILVYRDASGTPTVQTIPNFLYYYFGGFDTNGNLFADGKDESGNLTLGEVPAGSNTGHQITITGGTVYFPGLVQWYRLGNDLAVGDQQCDDADASCIYWVSISGSTGSITGKTTLQNYEGGQICDLVQGVIAANRQKYLAGGDNDYCGYASRSVNRWLYPGGGLPTNYNDSFGPQEPIGAAVSTK